MLGVFGFDHIEGKRRFIYWIDIFSGHLPLVVQVIGEERMKQESVFCHVF